MNSDNFIKYEVVYWIAGFILRRSLATFVFPNFSMATYESSKDIGLLFTKVLVAKVILTSHAGKEFGQGIPQEEKNITNGGYKDGKPHI